MMTVKIKPRPMGAVGVRWVVWGAGTWGLTRGLIRARLPNKAFTIVNAAYFFRHKSRSRVAEADGRPVPLPGGGETLRHAAMPAGDIVKLPRACATAGF